MSQYAHLTREELVARLETFEPTPAGPSRVSFVKKPKAEKPFVFKHYPTRHVALLIAYQGWHYSGLAIQHESNPVPTVEAELVKALEKTKLIQDGPEGGLDGSGYSRCGRTDRGVSGDGQVVDLWVRSNRTPQDGGQDLIAWKEAAEIAPPKPPPAEEQNPPKKPPLPTIPLEHPYPRLLNGVLPDSIRVIGWAPVEVEFNSRFSCKHRHYKYVFHPKPSPTSPLLDLDLMRQGAAHLLGEHDFRNFCKLDGSKQIENHNRNVLKAYFEQEGDLIVFNLIGTAFLWHQVRHVIGVLFLIGSKLERPELVRNLLDVQANPSKPTYTMGEPLPLTLYECAYEEDLDWRYGGYDGPWKSLPERDRERVKENAVGAKDILERQLESVRQEAEVRTWQVGGALRTLHRVYGVGGGAMENTLYPTGAGNVIMTGKYKDVLERPRGETPEQVNRKWREKGKRGYAREGEE